ncbi:hypothetical protein ZOSMA_39G00400 [Zostera marina]|uniref:Uncharacterized protein n=1 Tax=Zostera marina TaxID=29655 RepID=A0A0K9P6F6_ZOSMR|nr:hypothetical protein ZOSMA_39G00400 [Zostera marina]
MLCCFHTYGCSKRNRRSRTWSQYYWSSGTTGRGRASMPTMDFPPIMVSPLTFDCTYYIGSTNCRVPRRRRSRYPVNEIPEISPMLATLIPQRVPVPIQVVDASSSRPPFPVPEFVLQELQTSGLRPRPDEYVFGLGTPFAESDTEKSVLKKKATRKIKRCEMIMTDAVEIASTLESSEFRRLSANEGSHASIDVEMKEKSNKKISKASTSKNSTETNVSFPRELTRGTETSAFLIQHRCRIATYMTAMKDVALENKDAIATLQNQSRIPCASEEDVDDMCSLWLVVIFCTFLLPSSKMGLNGRVLSYIDNLNELHLINWVECVRYLIFTNMRECRKAVLKREEDKSISKPYLFGCTLVLNVESCYRNDFIPYVKVVKIEESHDKLSELSGLTGFMSPVRRSEEYNIGRHIKRLRKSFDSSPVERRYVVPIEHSPVLTASNSRVPEDEVVVVPKFENSLPMVDLITPEDGKARDDVIYVLSLIESDETHLKIKKIDLKRVGRKLKYDHLVECPVIKMTGKEFVNIMSGYFEVCPSRLTFSPPDKNSSLADYIENSNGPISEDTLFEDLQVHLRCNASLKPPWSYCKSVPFTPKRRTTPKHLRKKMSDYWRLDEFGVLQIRTPKTTTAPVDGSPKTPEGVGKVLEYSPKFWDSAI